MKEVWQSWLCQNIVTGVLSCVLLAVLALLMRRAPWRAAARRLFAGRGTVVSAVVLAVYVLVALLDSVGWRKPVLSPDTGQPLRVNGAIVYDKGASALDYMLKPLSSRREVSYSAPLAEYQFTTSPQETENGVIKVHKRLNYPGRHLLGTDIIGADVLVLSLKSIRTGIVIGFLTTLLAIPFALLFGLSAGYYGGWMDDTVQAICTLLSSVPSVLLIAALMLVFGRGLPQLCIAMGLASWTGLCRLLRGEAMRLREADYVTAAVGLGVPARKIILRHILPNVMHLIIINVLLRFSSEVLAEAALTYLGIGVDADTMSWGMMINDARMELTRHPVIWWKLTAAFIFMVGLLLPANILGDAARDALDPKLSK